MANLYYDQMKNNKLVSCVILIITSSFFLQCAKTASSNTSTLNQDKYKVWQLVDNSSLAEALGIKNAPKKYDVLKLKISKIKHLLKALEAKGKVKDNISYVEAEKPSMLIDLPFPFGKFYSYRIENSSLFSPELAKKFPDIRSYSGHQKDNEAVKLRLDVNPTGLFAIITSPSETVYIRPIENDYYICYKKSDVAADNKEFYEPTNKK